MVDTECYVEHLEILKNNWSFWLGVTYAVNGELPTLCRLNIFGSANLNKSWYSLYYEQVKASSFLFFALFGDVKTTTQLLIAWTREENFLLETRWQKKEEDLDPKKRPRLGKESDVLWAETEAEPKAPRSNHPRSKRWWKDWHESQRRRKRNLIQVPQMGCRSLTVLYQSQ